MNIPRISNILRLALQRVYVYILMGNYNIFILQHFHASISIYILSALVTPHIYISVETAYT